MTSPALCCFEGSKWDVKRCTFHFLTGTKKLQQSFYEKHFAAHGQPSFELESNSETDKFERFNYISNWALQIINDFQPDYVAIEGYSMGSTVGRAFDIAENTCLLKYKLLDYGYKFVVYPPKTIKKFATKNGNCNKQDMNQQFLADTELNLNQIFSLKSSKPIHPIEDIVDSYYLCKLLYQEHDQLI